MASGFFPLETRRDAGKELWQMAKRIDEIQSELRGSISEYCVPEDAAIDGEYLQLLDTASRNLKQCLDNHVSPERVIRKAQGILANHIPPDGDNADDMISELLQLLDGPDARAALGNPDEPKQQKAPPA